MACEMVEKCYVKDQDITVELLTRPQNKLINSINLVDVAFRFKCIEFMSMKCIISIINKRWYDRIDLNRGRLIVKKQFQKLN